MLGVEWRKTSYLLRVEASGEANPCNSKLEVICRRLLKSVFPKRKGVVFQPSDSQ